MGIIAGLTAVLSSRYLLSVQLCMQLNVDQVTFNAFSSISFEEQKKKVDLLEKIIHKIDLLITL